LQNISKQSYSKEFSSLNIHSKRFTKVYKIPPNWNRGPSHHRGIPFLLTHEKKINRSFLLLLCIIFPLPWNKVVHIRLPWQPQRVPNIASSNSLNIHPEAKELLLPLHLIPTSSRQDCHLLAIN
jgi:hypothetical protein